MRETQQIYRRLPRMFAKLAIARKGEYPRRQLSAVCSSMCGSASAFSLKTSEEFDRVFGIRAVRIFPAELRARAHDLVLALGGSMMPEIERANCLTGACGLV
jgi:hypothetical protein